MIVIDERKRIKTDIQRGQGKKKGRKKARVIAKSVHEIGRKNTAIRKDEIDGTKKIKGE